MVVWINPRAVTVWLENSVHDVPVQWPGLVAGEIKEHIMPADHEHFMRLAIEEAAKGGAEGNSAVGSVIVRDGNIVAVGRNLVTSANDPTAHGEIVVIRQA